MIARFVRNLAAASVVIGLAACGPSHNWLIQRAVAQKYPAAIAYPITNIGTDPTSYQQLLRFPNGEVKLMRAHVKGETVEFAERLLWTDGCKPQ